MFDAIRAAITRHLKLGETLTELEQLRNKYAKLKSQIDGLYVPIGHFFSPLPSLEEIKSDEARIFRRSQKELPAIDMHEEEQLALLKDLAGYYGQMPFQANKTPGLRYYFENDAYTYGDGITLFGMIRHFQPKKIIEVGSGHSSCLILDTNDLFFNGEISTAFIEPYPEKLRSLITDDDTNTITVLEKRLQDVELSTFEQLEAGDFLFIDSTHVSKTNSDVNYLFFEILPRLSKGVYIHIHDVFWPFEYPKWWVYEGRGWNEAYILRAFLQSNQDIRVVLMNTFLREFHQEEYEKLMPLCLERMGGSIWLQKQ
jgi:hypothetical protein